MRLKSRTRVSKWTCNLFSSCLPHAVFCQVTGSIIWGNHSSTQYPDITHCKVQGKPAKEVIGDDAWYKDVMIPCVQKRGAAIIAARKLSSALSAAQAISDHMNNWFLGTPEGTFVSMAVDSTGNK